MKPGTRVPPQPSLKETKSPRRKRMDPHSPWQRLVAERARELEISTRALADRISTAKMGYSHTTVWAWLRNTEGAPPKATYTNELNRNLAHALQLNPDVLAKAFQDSRSLLIIGDPAAAASGPLSILRRLFADSKQDHWTRAELVKLLDDLAGK